MELKELLTEQVLHELKEQGLKASRRSISASTPKPFFIAGDFYITRCVVRAPILRPSLASDLM